MYPKLIKLKICSLGLLFILVSCKDSKKNVPSFFDNEINYKSLSTEQTFNFDNIYQPQIMKVIGDKLLISDSGSESAFHVLEIQDDNSLKYLKGVGKVGRGPGEFTRLMDFIDVDSIILAYDGAQLKLIGYDKNLNILPEKEIMLNTQGMATSFYSIQNGKFVSVGLFFDDRFQVYDSNGEILGQFGNIIPIKENFTNRDNALAWRSLGAVNPATNSVYLFSANANNIEMYNLDGKLLKTVKGNGFPMPNMALDESGWPVDNGGIMAYEGLDVDNEFIYGFYSGAKRSSFKQGEGNLFEQMEFNKIHKFDWELNVVSAYLLDHIPSSFAVDGNGGVYTLSQNEKGTIIRYTKLD